MAQNTKVGLSSLDGATLKAVAEGTIKPNHISVATRTRT